MNETGLVVIVLFSQLFQPIKLKLSLEATKVTTVQQLLTLINALQRKKKDEKRLNIFNFTFLYSAQFILICQSKMKWGDNKQCSEIKSPESEEKIKNRAEQSKHGLLQK